MKTIAFSLLVIALAIAPQTYGQYYNEDLAEEHLPIGDFARTRFVRQGYGAGPVEEILPVVPYKNEPVIEKLPNYGGGGDSYGKSPASLGGGYPQGQGFGNGGGGGGGGYGGGGSPVNFAKPPQGPSGYSGGGGSRPHGGGHHRQPSNYGGKSPISFGGGGGYGAPQKQEQFPQGGGGYGAPQKQEQFPQGGGGYGAPQGGGGFGAGGGGYGNSAPIKQQYNQQPALPAYGGGQPSLGQQPGYDSYSQPPIVPQGAGGYGPLTPPALKAPVSSGGYGR